MPGGIVVNDEAPDRWAGTPAPSSPAPGAPEIEEIEPGPEIPPETFDDADRDVSGFDFEPNELRGDHDAGRTTAPGLDYSLSDAELELETDEAQLPREPSPAEEPSTDTTDELQLEPEDDLIAAPDTDTARPEGVSDTRVPDARHEDTDTDVLREIPPEDTDATLQHRPRSGRSARRNESGSRRSPGSSASSQPCQI